MKRPHFLISNSIHKEDITRLKSSLVALTYLFKEYDDLEKQLQELVIEGMIDEGELDSIFDEVTEVTSQQRGKLTELELIISKYSYLSFYAILTSTRAAIFNIVFMLKTSGSNSPYV